MDRNKPSSWAAGCTCVLGSPGSGWERREQAQMEALPRGQLGWAGHQPRTQTFNFGVNCTVYAFFSPN